MQDLLRNNFNYYQHVAYVPKYCHMQFERLSKKDLQSYWGKAQYVMQVASPLINLSKPLGRGVFLSSLAIRTVSTGKNIFNTPTKTKEQILLALTQALLITAAISSALFDCTLGVYVTGIGDIYQNIIHIIEGDLNEIIPLIISILYLSTIHTGSLEITLAFLVMQSLFSCLQSYQYWKYGDYWMAGSKLFAGCVRAKQSHDQYQKIQRRNFLLEVEKVKALFEKIKAFRRVHDIKEHPLRDVERILAKQHLAENLDGTPLNFGAYLNQMGKELVKGMSLNVKDTGDHVQLSFKLNHVARQNLQETIEAISSHKEEVSELMRMEKVSSSIEISEIEENKMHKTQISLGKNITVTLGNDPKLYNSYDSVKVSIPKECSQYDVHGAFSLLGLDHAIRPSTIDDIERLKIGQLFRLHNPAKASEFERTKDFFSLPIYQLRETIVQLDPNMKSHFEKELDRMQFHQLHTGKARMHFEGLSEELKKEGAKALTAMIFTGQPQQIPTEDLSSVFYETILEEKKNDFQKTLDRLGGILKTGMLSLEQREEVGMAAKGLMTSTVQIDRKGAKDSVFVQLVTKATKPDFSHSEYSQFQENGVRLLIDPKVLDSVTYQYFDDLWGVRGGSYSSSNTQQIYAKRPDIHTFVKEVTAGESRGSVRYSDQEVMIKDSIDPEYIQGVVVRDEFAKKEVERFLVEKELVHKEKSEYRMKHNQKPLDEFVQVVPRV